MMTPKERWLAAMRMEPVDRLPFWPKINESYARAQSPPFHDMEIDALHEWIGSDEPSGLPSCIKEVRTNTCVETTVKNGCETTVYSTPNGTTEQIQKLEPNSQSWHPVTFPVRGRDDLRLMTEIYADTSVELDEELLGKATEHGGRNGRELVTISGTGPSPLMWWVQMLAGIETAHYLLADCPGEVEALFDAMHSVRSRRSSCSSSTARPTSSIFAKTRQRR